MKKTLSFFIIALLTIPGVAQAKPKAIDLSGHTPENAAIRSLLIPGWGQSFNGQRAKSYIVAGGVLLSGITSYYFYSESESTYEDYEKVGVKNGSLYNDYQEQSDQATIFTAVAAGFWIYGIVDAYFSGKSKYENASLAREKKEGLACGFSGKRIDLAYRMNF